MSIDLSGVQDRSFTYLGSAMDVASSKIDTKLPNSSIVTNEPSQRNISRTNNYIAGSSDDISTSSIHKRTANASSFAALPGTTLRQSRQNAVKQKRTQNMSVLGLESDRKLFLPEEIHFPSTNMDLLSVNEHCYDDNDANSSSLLNQLLLRGSKSSFHGKPAAMDSSRENSVKRYNGSKMTQNGSKRKLMDSLTMQNFNHISLPDALNFGGSGSVYNQQPAVTANNIVAMKNHTQLTKDFGKTVKTRPLHNVKRLKQ